MPAEQLQDLTTWKSKKAEFNRICINMCIYIYTYACVCVCLNHDYESVQSLESKQEKQCHCTGLGRPHNVPPHEPSQCHPRRQSRCMDNFANRKPVSWGILKGRFESTTAQPHMATTYSGIFFCFAGAK